MNATWIVVFLCAVIMWVGGGLAVWRGAHIANVFLSGGFVVMFIGLVFMVLGLWTLRAVFDHWNPAMKNLI